MADKYVDNILRLWNLECLIQNFREGKIDSAAFKYLDSSAISALIPTKDLQMMFKSKYKQYKNLEMAGLSFDQTRNRRKSKIEEIDLTNEEKEDSQPISESQSSSFDIEFILLDSLAGRQVIEKYNEIGRLDYNSSLSLVNILVDYLISQSDDFSIDNDVLNEIADAIVTKFPNERKETYYRCIGEQMKGVLVDCYYIVRKKLLRKERRKRKHTSNAQNKTNRDIGPNATASSNHIIENQEPMPEWVDVESQSEEIVNVKWASHRDSLLQGLPILLAKEKYVDTTIVCEGQSIKCHKIVLCSYSSYFEKILESSPCKHPVIVLADLELWAIHAVINFMYMGELNVEEQKLPRLFEIATKLNVKGLSNIDVDDYGQDIEMTETASIGQEVFDDPVAEDPLSISPTVSHSKKRKQNLNNVVEPLATFSTVTLSDNLPIKERSDNFLKIEATNTEVFEECITFPNNNPRVNPLSLGGAKHRLQSLPGKVWRLCDVCRQRGWKRYARYWCLTCDVGVHQRCYYNKHKQLMPKLKDCK